jgi:prepilin-type N-terminal cleavage/methylation domain-containing protein
LRRLPNNEEGFGLVELLIAMVVMSIGISAIVAGYSSGILAVGRAKTTTTAGALADRQMEVYRQGSFAAVPTTPGAPPSTPPPSGYSMQIDGASSCVLPNTTLIAGSPPTCSGYCAVGTFVAGSPPICSGAPPTSLPVASRPVTIVTITVRDDSTGKLLFTETSTFDSSTG